MELIVWIILFNTLMGVVLTLQYWSELLRGQDSYTREELLDFLTIIPNRLKRLAGEHELGFAIVSFSAGIGMAWMLTLLGGLFSENVAQDIPDHCEGGVPNYFFQSALFIFVLHIAWPSFKEFALERGGEDGVAYRLLSTEIPFFVGVSVCIASINLTAWGVYHEMSFLFALADILILLSYAGYRIDSLEEHGTAGPMRSAPPAKKSSVENDDF